MLKDLKDLKVLDGMADFAKLLSPTYEKKRKKKKGKGRIYDIKNALKTPIFRHLR